MRFSSWERLWKSRPSARWTTFKWAKAWPDPSRASCRKNSSPSPAAPSPTAITGSHRSARRSPPPRANAEPRHQIGPVSLIQLCFHATSLFRSLRGCSERSTMPTPVRIGIIGDFEPSYHSHFATNAALYDAATKLKVPLLLRWLPTPSLDGADAPKILSRWDGLI